MKADFIISKEEDRKWLKSGEYGALRWKLLVDSTITRTSGVSVGLLKIKSNEKLALHHHSQKEIYIIKKGKGNLITPDKTSFLKAGDLVFIPENVIHGIQNNGKMSMLLYWIFPTDCWQQVKYNFVT